MSDTKWFLIDDNYKNIKYKKRKKIPKWYLDLLDGKKIKIKINLKDWKFVIGANK